MLFRRLIEQAVVTHPVTRDELIINTLVEAIITDDIEELIE
jgi:hypothetical protein